MLRNLLTTTIIFTWSLGQLAFLPSPSPSVHWYLLDLLNLITLLIILATGWRKIRTDPLTPYFGIFLLVALFSLLFNLPDLGLNTTLLSSLYLLRFLATLSLYYLAKYYFPNRFSRYLLISLTLFLSLGLVQYIFLPDTRFLKIYGFDDHYYRLIGTFLDPNFTGAILAAAALFLLAKRSYLLTLPVLLSLSLTFSRASYLSFFFSLLLLILLKKNIRLILLSLLLIIFVYLIPKPFGEGVNLFRTYSITSRLATQKDSIDLFLQKPFLGHGFNSLRFLNQTNAQIPNRAGSTDNSYLFVLATTGLIGFVVFGLLLIKIGQAFSLDSAYFVVYLSLLFHSLFNNTFFYLWILSPLLFALGYLLRKVKSK